MGNISDVWVGCIFKGKPPEGYKDWNELINSRIKYGVKVQVIISDKKKVISSDRKDLKIKISKTVYGKEKVNRGRKVKMLDVILLVGMFIIGICEMSLYLFRGSWL